MSRYVFDIETNGLLDELTTIHSLVLKDIDTGLRQSFCSSAAPVDTMIAKGYAPIEQGIETLMQASLIVGHNIIKFDIPALQKVYPSFNPTANVLDTLVLSRLIKADIKDDDFKLVKRGILPGNQAGNHGLESWGYRLGKWKGDYAQVMTARAKAEGIKDKRAIMEFVWGRWNPEMQDYCEQDVEVTEALLREFWRILGNGWSEECVALEHSVAHIIARQERYGFAFDVEEATRLYATLTAHAQRLSNELQRTFPPKEVRTVFVPKVNSKKLGYEKGVPFAKVKIVPFNPASRQQVAERLQGLGWEPSEFGKDGIATVDDEILNRLPYPEAKVLAEFFMVNKRLGQVATGKEAWLKHERKGRIHGEVVTNGAVTGRMTHKRPNVAQVPAITSRKTGEKQPYGKECRLCFTASKDKVLVGCDADALELRDLAGYMARYDEGAYIRTILEGRKEDGTDMHSVNARALGCSRDTAKVWFYAFIYGAGDEKLGLILGATGNRARAVGRASRAKFLRNLPALGKIVDAVKAKVKSQGYLKGLDGRKLRIRSEHAAINTLLQSAGAIQMKRALVILDNGLQAKGYVPGTDYEFVANVHDEWQIDTRTDIADEVGAAAADAIRLAGEYYSFRCPLKGNYEVGRTWADTH